VGGREKWGRGKKSVKSEKGVMGKSLSTGKENAEGLGRGLKILMNRRGGGGI